MTRGVIFVPWRRHGVRELSSAFMVVLLIGGKWMSGSSAPQPHPVGSSTITAEMFYLHTTAKESKDPAQGQVGGLSHCPRLRLVRSSLDFMASPSGVCSAYGAHSGIRNAREGRMPETARPLPACVHKGNRGQRPGIACHTATSKPQAC